MTAYHKRELETSRKEVSKKGGALIKLHQMEGQTLMDNLDSRLANSALGKTENHSDRAAEQKGISRATLSSS